MLWSTEGWHWRGGGGGGRSEVLGGLSGYWKVR